MTVFEFRSMDSFLHNRDVRYKLFCFAAMTITGLYAGYSGLFLLMMFPICYILRLRISLVMIIRDTRFFLLLLGFVFFARALSTPGETLITYKSVDITRQGLTMAGIVCVRLVLTVLMCLILMVTTKISRIREAVAWLFAPVPFIPEKRTATMIGLLVRFLPIILTQAKVISIAQRARCIENRKNPVFRLASFSVPFIKRVLYTADNLAIAMESRCYSEDRTGPGFSPNTTDRVMAVFCALLCCAAVYAG